MCCVPVPVFFFFFFFNGMMEDQYKKECGCPEYEHDRKYEIEM